MSAVPDGRPITDVLPLPIVQLDAAGVVVQGNAAWRRLAREAGDAAQSRTGPGATFAAALQWLGGGDVAELEQVDAAVRGARTSCAIEVTTTHGDRPRVYCCHVESQPPGAVAWLEDVTARKRIEAEAREQGEANRRLNHLLTAAQDANRMKDEFLGTLSHELRPPLNAIVGWAHLLRRGGLDEESAHRALEAIGRNANVQTRLISDILDVSSIVAGKLSLELRPVELPAVIRLALETAAPAAEAKGVRLQSRLEDEGAVVRGDADRLRQVVWNLLSNAIKFTPRGGRVCVSLTRAGDSVEIAVEDTAPGGGRVVPNVFGSSMAVAGGLGLGLAIVRHLVELHGGTIQSGSASRGYGASYVVRLPRLALDAGETVPHRAADPARPAAQLDLTGVRILLVEDEEDSREVLTRILEQRGADVQAVSSATEAFDALQARVPNVLLSDIGMPGEDGYSLMRRVRNLAPEKGGTVPAAALTAFARSDDRMKALLSGFQLHIPKPVQPDELVAVVSTLAGRNVPAAG